MNSFFVCGIRVDDAPLSEILQTLNTRLSQNLFTHIVTVNATFVLESSNQPELKKIFTPNTLSIPESIGLSWLARFKKGQKIGRLPGIDLMQILCEQAAQKGQKVYLLGAAPSRAQTAAKVLQDRFKNLQVVGSHHGYFSKDQEPEIVQTIRQSGAQFVFVALTMPKQEQWIFRHSKDFEGMVVMGVGGSFDVLSGSLKRAPFWMQRVGLEWLFRLLQEPKRFLRILRLPKIFFLKD